MPSWDPAQYAKFGDHRLRPALDLIGRIPDIDPRRVVDLGSGPGEITEILAGRWREAEVVGLDSSADMLTKARALAGRARYVEGDVATWMASPKVDLLFSNACLQWLADHASLFPRLVQQVAPGGTIAIQMPHNHDQPSHRIIARLSEEPPFLAQLAGKLRHDPVASPDAYWRMLKPLVARLDIWEVDYLQALTGDDPVLNWTMGTALRPVLDALDKTLRAKFIEEYRDGLRAAYPRESEGSTLFPFRRLFIVAER
ncbi:MAG: methyltransferase domain-containing protein [Alphaproteobacteria bacterium]|nr:methyltransferase domain-containing protein [Alphaproteobacteria bacterium]